MDAYQILALVVRNDKNEILSLQAVSDGHGYCKAIYPCELIPSIDALRNALSGEFEPTKKQAYFDYVEGKLVTLEGEAHALPSIGKVKVALELRLIAWDAIPHKETGDE